MPDAKPDVLKQLEVLQLLFPPMNYPYDELQVSLQGSSLLIASLESSLGYALSGITPLRPPSWRESTIAGIKLTIKPTLPCNLVLCLKKGELVDVMNIGSGGGDPQIPQNSQIKARS